MAIFSGVNSPVSFTEGTFRWIILGLVSGYTVHGCTITPIYIFINHKKARDGRGPTTPGIGNLSTIRTLTMEGTWKKTIRGPCSELRWRPRLPRGSFFVESQKNPIESMWFLSVYLPTWMNGWCLWEMYCKLIYSPRLPNTLGFEAFGPPKTYKENTKPQQVFGRLGFYIDPTGDPFIIFYPVAYFHAFSKIWSLGSLPSSMLLGGNHPKLFGRGPTTQSLANLLIMVINHHEPPKTHEK